MSTKVFEDLKPKFDLETGFHLSLNKEFFAVTLTFPYWMEIF